jgi:hypothetical protein
MAIKTREQLVNEALKNLQAVGAGQSAAAEDYDEVDDKVESLVAQLSVDEVCDVTDLSEIPAEWFDALAELLANSCATKFGQQYSADKKMHFEKMLRRATAPRATLEVLRTDYF